ncbi:MAG: hypothetical protein KDC84_06230 [Crocinitomicaceae bacterium]|nr:hypothetical protein [Crocinitomicaceae bacterium]
MEKKFETVEFEKLVQTRENQLAQFRNVPNKLEVVWEQDGKVILNNASSTDIESALEAISAVRERVVWITEMDYSEINFHGILGGLLNKLDKIIHVGENNPFEKLGSGAVHVPSLQDAVKLGWESLNDNAYLVYAPAILPEKTIRERGELFRNEVTKLWS